MTHVPGDSIRADASAATRSIGPLAPLSAHAIATLGAWYLLAAALIPVLLGQFVVHRRASGLLMDFLGALAFGAAPLRGGPGSLGTLLHVAVLAVGLWCVITKSVSGVRIAYGIQVALGLYATSIVLGLQSGNGFLASYSYLAQLRHFGLRPFGGLWSLWLVVELSGVALAGAFMVAIVMDAVPRISHPAGPAGTSLMAILAFVCGVGGGLGGVVLGHIALSQIKHTGERGRGLALAGTILGYLWLTLLVVWFLAMAVLAHAESGF